MIRHYVEKNYKIESDERGKDQGVLLGSGLIAGEGLMGVIIAVFAVVMSEEPNSWKYPIRSHGLVK